MEEEKVEQKQENQSPTLGKLAEALAKAQGEMEGAKKDSENPFFKQKYADLSSVWDACRKPLSNNGLSIVQTMANESGKVIIITTLLHSSGEWMRGALAVKPLREDPQSMGSVITYGRRYSLAAIAGISPEDDDAEGAMERGKSSPITKPVSKSEMEQEKSEGKQPKEEAGLLIMDVTAKNGTNKQGKLYKLYTIIDSNDIKHKTFDTKFAEIAQKAQEEGLEVEIESKESKFGNNLINIEIKNTVRNDEDELIPPELQPSPEEDEGELTPEKCYIRAEELIKSVQEITDASHLKDWGQKHRKEMFTIKKIEPDAYKKITLAIGKRTEGIE